MPEVSLSSCELILASASPRRRELLDQIGVRYYALVPVVDEAVLPNETVLAHVRRLALAKASAGRALLTRPASGTPVLGADTVVEIDGRILGKPVDSKQASRMLTRLSGKTHRVHTAVALTTDEGKFVDANTTEVEFATLDQQQIERYIATGESMGKAGAYAIQGIAAQFVRCIRGSYSSVMGLPLYETARLLACCGISGLYRPKSGRELP